MSSNPDTPVSVGYVDNSPTNIAYFENLRRIADYRPIAESWQGIAVEMARLGQQPPAPPTPPFKVEGYINSAGNVSLRELTEYVVAKPEPIAPQIQPSGEFGFGPNTYQAPFDDARYEHPGRIFAATFRDTITPADWKGEIPASLSWPQLKPGVYQRVVLPGGSMFGGGGQVVYDPVK